jgi:hypothetical protein
MLACRHTGFVSSTPRIFCLALNLMRPNTRRLAIYIEDDLLWSGVLRQTQSLFLPVFLVTWNQTRHVRNMAAY